MQLLSRRVFLAGGAGTALSGLLPSRAVGTGLTPTPTQTTGPFYPIRLPLDRDNDLIRVAGRPRRAAGIVTHLVGRVLDISGRPVRSCLVEVWQCDAHGRYHHARDRSAGPVDPNFQGYGRFVTGDDGAYRFRTIRPVPYARRTPHIHFAVKGPGFEPLITQMYVAGEPRNRTDGILNDLPVPERRRLIVPLRPFAEGEPDSLIGRFDIVLDRERPIDAD